VSTSFRNASDSSTLPTEEELLIYESRQNEKKDDALLYISLCLAVMIVFVMLIFICQSFCSDHAKIEYQERALVYKKQDLEFRQTIMRRNTAK
jgi:hypothetical protein